MLYKFAICVVAKVPSVGKVMQQTISIFTNVSAVACENPSSVGSVMQYEYYTWYSLEYNVLASKVPSVGKVM